MKRIEYKIRKKCSECNNPFNLPEDYEDFSNRDLIRCPQCDNLMNTLEEVEE